MKGAAKPNDKLVSSISTMMKELGVSINEDGTQETPRRVAGMFRELFKREDFKFTTFVDDRYDQMIMIEEIPFVSLCEHHMLPFFGNVTIGYLPSHGKIAGLSKFARAVQYHSRGLQVQERLTVDIAQQIETVLQPAGVGVIIRARHLCMEIRGAKSVGAMTVTSELRGKIRSDSHCRNEFMHLAKR